MSGQVNEHAFESYVEEILLGRSGWQRGPNADWDVELALFPKRIHSFIEATQPKLWSEMRALHGEALEPLLIQLLRRSSTRREPCISSGRVSSSTASPSASPISSLPTGLTRKCESSMRRTVWR